MKKKWYGKEIVDNLSSKLKIMACHQKQKQTKTVKGLICSAFTQEEFQGLNFSGKKNRLWDGFTPFPSIEINSHKLEQLIRASGGSGVRKKTRPRISRKDLKIGLSPSNIIWICWLVCFVCFLPVRAGTKQRFSTGISILLSSEFWCFPPHRDDYLKIFLIPLPYLPLSKISLE